MTKEEMARHMATIFEDCNRLRDKAHHEYAHDENAFSNFIRLGKLLELSPEKILMVYFTKHIDGITAHVNGYRSQRESVHGRIRDAIVYLTLLDGMFIEEERKVIPATGYYDAPQERQIEKSNPVEYPETNSGRVSSEASLRYR